MPDALVVKIHCAVGSTPGLAFTSFTIMPAFSAFSSTALRIIPSIQPVSKEGVNSSPLVIQNKLAMLASARCPSVLSNTISSHSFSALSFPAST